LLKVPAAALLELTRTETRAASVWYDMQDVIRFQRGDASFLQSLQQVTRESTGGELRSFWTRLRVGPSETQSTGVVDGEQISVEAFRGQKRSSKVSVWEAEARGSLAVMQSLKNRPIQAGETRKIKHLLPIKNQIATVNLVAVGETSVPWIDGTSRLLLEVTEDVTIGGQVATASVLWVDRRGEIQRTYTPAMGLVSYRVDAQTVQSRLAETGAEEWLDDVDQVPPAWVGVGGKKVDRPERLQRLALVVDPIKPDGDVTLALTPFPDQYVDKLTDGRIKLLISRKPEKLSSGFRAYQTESSAADTRQTAMLNFTSKIITDMSRAALKGASLSDQEIALELTRTTDTLLEQTSFAGDFSKASDVLLAAKGGAFDHAVLLAAMLRERKVPSRLALGLVYLPDPEPRLAFSAWTLALADGRWIALDPLTGGMAPADRVILKMIDTTGPIDQSVFVPIFQWMEQVKIRVQGFSKSQD